MRTIETSIQRKQRITIIECIEEVIDVPREYWEVKRTKKENEVMIRHIYIYFLKKYGDYTLEKMAELCGLKYHSSILRNLKMVESWLASPEDYPHPNEIINKVEQLYEQRNS